MRKYDFDDDLILMMVPCIIASTILNINLFSGGKIMSDIGQILIATLPTVGVITISLFQLRSGNKRIDEARNDTKVILPKTENIERYTLETNGYITKNIHRNLEDIRECTKSDILPSINELLEDLRYREKLKMEYAGSIVRDTVVSNIDKLFEENARLKERVRELEIEKETLIQKVKKYETLSEELRRNKERNRDLTI